MTSDRRRDRDPLGKRALFSEGQDPERGPTDREALAVTVHCSSCDADTPMSIGGFLVQHLPVWAWLPWKRHSHLMRCPACGSFTWLSVT